VKTYFSSVTAALAATTGTALMFKDYALKTNLVQRLFSNEAIMKDYLELGAGLGLQVMALFGVLHISNYIMNKIRGD
ncbi:MAG: hypothetical protein KJ847_04205, partial [Firmicutes bacterium]|nr:hypothetical protein [Bacillota bacterium]